MDVKVSVTDCNIQWIHKAINRGSCFVFPPNKILSLWQFWMDFMYLESDRSLIVVSRNLEYDYCDSED